VRSFDMSRTRTQVESINSLLTRRYLIRTTAALLINAPRTRALWN